ncbi:hypothetical protein [Scrofimicrobium sp. R131]|uniref:Lipocalin-like domain-containing protein n=1 Tax=Scrofimicrobium appendicitidis TaxID=3079930 RepID=A0AAU7V4D1_9ACTO
MLKKVKSLIAIAAVAGAALLGGCSSGNSSATDFVGDWTLVGIGGQQSVGAEELAALDEIGATITLAVHDDGTVEMQSAGQTLEGTWEAGKDGDASFTFDGQSATGTVEGTTLTLAVSDAGDTMTFEKGKAETDQRSDVDEEDEVVNEDTQVEE